MLTSKTTSVGNLKFLGYVSSSECLGQLYWKRFGTDYIRQTSSFSNGGVPRTQNTFWYPNLDRQTPFWDNLKWSTEFSRFPSWLIRVDEAFAADRRPLYSKFQQPVPTGLVQTACCGDGCVGLKVFIQCAINHFHHRETPMAMTGTDQRCEMTKKSRFAGTYDLLAPSAGSNTLSTFTDGVNDIFFIGRAELGAFIAWR